MADLPHAWQLYADNQHKLNNRLSADSAAWGLEAGLTALLDGSATPDVLDRTIASGARRSRYARALLTKYVRIGGGFDALAYLEARSALDLIGRRLPPEKVSMLLTAVVAPSANATTGADRTRLARARSAARRIAA